MAEPRERVPYPLQLLNIHSVPGGVLWTSILATTWKLFHCRPALSSFFLIFLPEQPILVPCGVAHSACCACSARGQPGPCPVPSLRGCFAGCSSFSLCTCECSMPSPLDSVHSHLFCYAGLDLELQSGLQIFVSSFLLAFCT